MLAKYENDIIAWSVEQANHLKSGRFDLLDIEHIVDEIIDVGKSEQREFESRMAVLLAHLLKWSCQPSRRCKSWLNTIKVQRKSLKRRLTKTPSLKPLLSDAEFIDDCYSDAKLLADKETGLIDEFPEVCEWSTDEIMEDSFFPGSIPPALSPLTPPTGHP